MPKPKKIDLNDYMRVGSEEDLADHIGLIITPARLNDGTQLPDWYFRKPIKQADAIIEDTTNAVWHKDCLISTKGSDVEYQRRCSWWLENALKDSEYRNIINNMCSTAILEWGFDVAASIDKFKRDKLFREGARNMRLRKLHQPLLTWLSRGCDFARNSHNRQKGYRR